MLIRHSVKKTSCSPLHLLHQLEQGLLELVADGGCLVFSGDCAALPPVASSLLTQDLSVSHEQVRHHLSARAHTRSHTELPHVPAVEHELNDNSAFGAPLHSPCSYSG